MVNGLEGAMTDAEREQRVRAYWERVERPEGVGGAVHVWIPEHAMFESWQAADEFTEQRQEEIRQLRSQIAHVDDIDVSAEEWREWAHDKAPGVNQDYVRMAIRGHCTECLLIARLQAALAELERGMKKEAK